MVAPFVVADNALSRPPWAEDCNHTQFSGYDSQLQAATLSSPFLNLAKNADGSINNKNGFGSVSGARDPRILQTVIRVQF